MRSLAAAILCFTLLALYWACQKPVTAWWDVRRLQTPGADTFRLDAELLALGPAALPALRAGLHSGTAEARLHCAKVLCVLGEPEGEDALLDSLRHHPEPADPLGRAAEAFLISAWDLRNGPDEALRRKLRQAEAGPGHVPEQAALLNEALQHYPEWADGYARRARIFQQADEAYEARRDALYALARAPNHWEAIVTLGRVEAAVDAPQLALNCFLRALQVNPRLKRYLRDDLRNSAAAVRRDQEKRREERRKTYPLV